MNPHWDLVLPFFAPLIKTVCGNNAPASIDERLKGRQFRQGFGTGVDHPVAYGRICGPMWNQPPVREPAFVAALVPDDDRNRWRSLFGSDVKAWRVVW